MLRSRLFSNNQRLKDAANNNPVLRRGDPDQDAVRLLQQALRDLQIATMRRSIRSNGMFDGDFGGETFRAVQRFQRQNSIGGATGTGSGVADRETLTLMDGQLDGLGVEPLTPTSAATAAPPVETPSTLGRGIPRLPTGAQLRAAYDAYTSVGGKPCQREITHQCAIRLTIALARSNIGFHLSPSRVGELYVHSPNSDLCGGGLEAHDASASRVFRYISGFWDFTQYSIHRTMTGRDIYQRIKDTPAIIFFHKLGSGTNHIDYFDGARIMNDELNYAAPGEPRRGRPDATFHATRRAIHVLPLLR
jgi:peptidoglycan hydrolase-like protein with peptidoglycan-binding domain